MCVCVCHRPLYIVVVVVYINATFIISYVNILPIIRPIQQKPRPIVILIVIPKNFFFNNSIKTMSQMSTISSVISFILSINV